MAPSGVGVGVGVVNRQKSQTKNLGEILIEILNYRKWEFRAKCNSHQTQCVHLSRLKQVNEEGIKSIDNGSIRQRAPNT